MFLRLAVLCCSLLIASSGARADAVRLQLAVSEWPPYEFSVQGAAHGLDIELARAAVKAMHQQPTFLFYPWKRVLLLAQRQEVDGILSVRPTPERQQYLVFPKEHLSVSENVVFVRKGDERPLSSVAALSGQLVGVTAGYSYGEEFDALVATGAITTDESLTEEQGLRKLLAGRYAMLVCDQHAGWHLAHSLGMAEQLSALPLRISSVKNYLGFVRNAEGMARAARFDAAVAGLKKSGDWQRIQDAYRK
ncbi:transporter substrate-binding domain-containing protein [Curvibacter sp. APW13]|uniref:substrate-binding periplasmic protein n=1 Tax=Curvibacter sp. APW13 TaxID=3077236 RepID=UPI0028E03D34|nr:transporter substrate-binding domain-containing protein [Curvibacter sp. APW13]MDT8990632.1 transporter substrate-binding domain-containing protein [Curvibacter sp. APW13]